MNASKLFQNQILVLSTQLKCDLYIRMYIERKIILFISKIKISLNALRYINIFNTFSLCSSSFVTVLSETKKHIHNNR